MKVLIIFAIFYIRLQAAQSLPTNIEQPHEDLADTTSKLSDPNSALRLKLKSFMTTLVTSFQRIINKTLNQLPNTEAYEDSRRKLNQFLSSIQKYNGTKGDQLENCVWSIVDLGYDINVLRQSFTHPEATVEDKETLRLLDENGFKDADRQHTSYWWRFVREELGDNINEDYC